MAASNYIYQFAGDVGALVLSDGDYSSDGQRVIGNQPGIARADFVNKALRQSSYMAAVLAQYMVDYAVEDVLDSESVTLGVGKLVKALGLTTGFPAGTKMVFYQASAPLHWEQDLTNTDMALRVVNTLGGGIGGTHNFSTPPTAVHTHTTGSYQLLDADLPPHSHSVSATGTAITGGAHSHSTYIPPINRSDVVGNYTDAAYIGPSGPLNNYTYIGTAGSDHSHSVTVSGTAAAKATAANSHNHGATTGNGTLTAYAPKYIDVIVCTKL